MGILKEWCKFSYVCLRTEYYWTEADAPISPEPLSFTWLCFEEQKKKSNSDVDQIVYLLQIGSKPPQATAWGNWCPIYASNRRCRSIVILNLLDSISPLSQKSQRTTCRRKLWTFGERWWFHLQDIVNLLVIIRLRSGMGQSLVECRIAVLGLKVPLKHFLVMSPPS